MKRNVVAGFSSLSLLLAVAATHATYAAPKAPKPSGPGGGPIASAPPTTIGVMTATAAPPVFFKPSAGGNDTTPYAQQAQGTVKCSDNDFQLTVGIDSNGLATGICHKPGKYTESMKPGCPSGWGYVITDDKFVPEVKAKFGKTDMCFRNDDPRRDKKDPANYAALNCAITTSGATGGFVMVVKDGQDVCERERDTFIYMSPGVPSSTITRPTEAQTKSLYVTCPSLSYMWVDIPSQNRKVMVTASPGGYKGAGIFCQKG